MSGNVLCGCEDESDLGLNTTSIIGGKVFGPIDLPPVPTPPESLKASMTMPTAVLSNAMILRLLVAH